MRIVLVLDEDWLGLIQDVECVDRMDCVGAYLAGSASVFCDSYVGGQPSNSIECCPPLRCMDALGF